MKFIELNLSTNKNECEIEIEEFARDEQNEFNVFTYTDEGEQVPVPIREGAKIINIVQNLLSL